jgi:hypothetical protein
VSEPLIPGGCILLARKIIESAIWDKPPLYVKVWLFLLTRAQHSDYKGLRRGQLRTSIPEIIEGCKWHVGARVERPDKNQIFQIIEWLRSPEKGRFESNAKATREQRESNAGATMIHTTKATHGIIITIDNYSVYQEIQNYEGNGEGNGETLAKPQREAHGTSTNPDNINKNDKNDKNDNKNTSSRQSKTYAEESSPYRMAVYLHNKIMEYAEGIGVGHLVREAKMQKWADDCRKLLDLDNRNKDEIKQVIDWTAKHHFWQKQILSAEKLRKKYTDLVIQMAADRNSSRGPKRSGGKLSDEDLKALESEMREGNRS